jgi:hypothetical protein
MIPSGFSRIFLKLMGLLHTYHMILIKSGFMNVFNP